MIYTWQVFNNRILNADDFVTVVLAPSDEGAGIQHDYIFEGGKKWQRFAVMPVQIPEA
ncbi:TPA: hypothetical protein L9M77_005523 [Klebsiella variicola]|nr:hypothetical protein [Klebsiella variicola]